MHACMHAGRQAGRQAGRSFMHPYLKAGLGAATPSPVMAESPRAVEVALFTVSSRIC